MPTMTAAQQRAQARVAYDAFLSGCPSRQLLARISDKWTALVLAALGDGGARYPGAPSAPGPEEDPGGPRAMRFSELARTLAGVSQKMLTQTLRHLERDGLLIRTVTPTVPVTVTYELTDLGVSLHGLMREVKAWAELHMDDVAVAREAYDERATGSEGGRATPGTP